ncbi:class I SAM-dependent DNA methyltransferase [Trichlorobacter lovleyi]|uniref:class I SAM-dependent DNA methyltransferase n=1 Tax=Trichlorobacter lovleyi TaxID=313985 RepID=UPI00224070B4|nr:DNA methyltransferase [Trichlorobacter lovleyi]QOX80555.1 class I SAM-dependent DNA methyltransferase [Trichlorobacter lovleyi]
MPLSWNEIRDRALTFSREWADESSEDAEAKSFWDGFFNVFGITRRRVASFEAPVKKGDGAGGFIDLLWKGVLLVEHKSRGKDLDRAAKQAFDYFPGLKERDLPRYVLVSDFARFRLYDLDTNEQHNFTLAELSKHIQLFGFIAGYQTRSFGQQDPVNVQAAEKLGKLHDQFKATGYDGHPLEVLLVRLLFCLFSEDTALFERCQFQDYLEQRTAEDGSDLGMHLAQFFQVLDTPPEKRSKTLDEQLAAFPYVNGQLFSEMLPITSCDKTMRETLLDCCALDWSRISPAIFGSLFQSIMDTTARRNLGAHYTSETNILKLIRPLFLDELWAEFGRIKNNRNKLFEFLKKLGHLNFFDPACGCGNFLVIAYRELRLLELEVLRHVRQNDQLMLDVFQLIGVNVDQFHGIEIEEWPARIAEVALWLTDHQMNLQVSEEFGQYYARLPLKKAPHIVHGNALRLDWRDVVPPHRLSYLLGNPPFVGSKLLKDEQRTEVAAVFPDTKGAGVLDYVACWYRKAADYLADNSTIRAAFVSTNSITQGEQVGILWPDLLRRGIRIQFAHRTFQWSSEARGKAAVHCVIIGFGLQDLAEKWLFDYDTPKSEPHAVKAANINPYLVDGPNIPILKRGTPICNVPAMKFGNQPIDGGHLLLDAKEKLELALKEPISQKWLRRYFGSVEFINGIERWCLWLRNCNPDELRRSPSVMQRIEEVKQFRLSSDRAATRELAITPTQFAFISHQDTLYIIVPSVSSERRQFIPIGFMPSEVIASNLCLIIPNATLYHFGILSSTFHNSWMRAVCGRLKSDYRYSAGIVYNNFPWPEPTEKQQSAIEAAAQKVLDTRAQYPSATLADLYDPLTMPPDLVKAHQALDKAVDAAYGKTGFKTEAERVAFLFERYQQLTAPLVAAEKKKAVKKRNA